MEIVLLKRIECKRCFQIFYVCRSCWRGQAYCCQECRQEARKEAHCKAQKKYRQTPKGKEAHRRQEKNKRLRQAEKTMDDTSTIPGVTHDSVSPKPLCSGPCCHFCGKIGWVVEHFPWRGYAKRPVRANQ